MIWAACLSANDVVISILPVITLYVLKNDYFMEGVFNYHKSIRRVSFVVRYAL